MTKVCAFPNCFTGIHTRTITGLCRDHSHAIGLCRCAKCAGAKRQHPVRSTRGDTQVTLVKGATSTSTAKSFVPVRLKKLPWTMDDQEEKR